MFFLAEDKGVEALPPGTLRADRLMTGLRRVVTGSKLHEASPLCCQDTFEGSKLNSCRQITL